MSLTITSVSHSYGALRVLDGVCLSVPRGGFASILGESGCGKTTLLRIVAGLVRPETGTVELGGRDITGLAPQHRRVALVPQEGALFPHLSVAGNVGFGLRKGDRGRVADLLDLVGLGDLAARMPHEISGGQAQRVAVARALAVSPELVLLDEPFSALDAQTRQGVRADVSRVLAETGTTAILVTHDREEALSMSDQLAIMESGRIVQDGPPEEVYARPDTVTAARLTGPVMVLPGQADGPRASTQVGCLALASAARGVGAVLLRPEQVRIGRNDGQGRRRATVTSVTFYGHDADLGLLDQGSGTQLCARVQECGLAAGDEVHFWVEGPGVFVA
ncbi:MAG: ABC transporter ATP-binding protein [Propionibacteriaceae bacterium]|nr:ABC transporter ATP-binding protein [Propionibacteriaceae bacterium]